MTLPSRVDRSPLARWFWTVDHLSLALIALIVTVGFVVLLAAGPASASRLGIDSSFHFPIRQIVFLVPALMIMIAVSMLTPLQARRLGAVTLVVAFVLIAATLAFAPEINGARRWLTIGAFSFQPTEFVKPGFVIVAAWMLAEGARNPKFPGAYIAAALYAVLIVMLAAQPDYGQAALVTAVWMTMFFVVGWSWRWILMLGMAGFGALIGGYFYSPHLARRVDAFFNPEGAESYQVDKALEAIAHGGVLGRGGEGATVKLQLPDAHTDFIFAVAGEEGGLLLCLTILALFGGLVLRFLAKASALKSIYAQCAVCGLAITVGLQSFINMAVSLRALPAKGMTLPFVSYGGSSLLATGLTLGLILCLIRAEGPIGRRKEIMP